ncbi:hypothetical protein CLV30_11354 [Haloactinopolyspora alba]|uniref:Uncharacterized protein n=1 Tax=Haloactinopolyspora alba TaxID=648780 RepID=A0A2P8DWG7_9ACTN|nr:hypothetical protein [Haloactinopolyspora alba]PSL01566.1 hypothetical protein CLV30_11354 [Haloactinopolyspora alba]
MAVTRGGGGGGSYSSIDVDSFDSMISTLESRTEDSREEMSGLKASIESEDVDATNAKEILDIFDWVDDELPLLRRRLSLAKVADSGQADGLSAYISEPVTLPTEEELSEARDLADKIKNHGYTDEELAQIIHEVAGKLDTSDPDVMSEFFGRLGVQNTQMLASQMSASGSDTGQEDIRAFSRALGAATMDTDPGADFTEVVDAFATAPVEGDHLVNPAAWGRLALMQHGTFDQEFVEDVVNANALDRFSDNPDYDFRGGSTFDVQTTGLSEDVLALAFGALGNHPDAARNAINGLPGDMGDTVGSVFGYAESRGTGDDVADAFGQAINSGSGVNDEYWRDHSDEASRFALEFIKAAGKHPEVPWPIKDDMSELAASYRQEFLTGASMDDAEFRESRTTAPENFDGLYNVDPAFYLSPQDTYKFLHGFADNDELMAPFDEAMGEMFETLPSQAANADYRAQNDGEQDPRNFENMMTAFGNLAGLENTAMIDVRGDLDELEKSVREGIATVLTLGLAEVPTPQSIGPKLAWKAFTFAAGKGLGEYKKGGETRVDQVEAEDHQVALTVQYHIAESLIDADYPHTEMPDAITDDSGNLLPVEDIAKSEEAMRAFAEWSDSNNNGDVTPFDTKLDHGSMIFLGGQDDSEHRVRSWDLGEDWTPPE